MYRGVSLPGLVLPTAERDVAEWKFSRPVADNWGMHLGQEQMGPKVLLCSPCSSYACWLVIGEGHFFQKTGILTGHRCWGVTLLSLPSPAQPLGTVANLRPPVKLGQWSPPWSWESLGSIPSAMPCPPRPAGCGLYCLFPGPSPGSPLYVRPRGRPLLLHCVLLSLKRWEKRYTNKLNTA